MVLLLINSITLTGWTVRGCCCSEYHLFLKLPLGSSYRNAASQRVYMVIAREANGISSLFGY